MLRKRMFYFKTRVGTFRIIHRAGRWHAMFEDEDLGAYMTCQQAAHDLAGGHAFSPSCGDPSQYGVPDDLGEWSRG